jgi:hypothetical protein
MKVGDNPSISADFSNNASSMTLDEQIINQLSVPVQKGDWKGANARRDAVKEIFEKLPPDQAKALYDRLQNYNWKDNLNDKFHGTFEDYSLNILKNTLKSRFEPQNGGTTATSGAPQTGSASGAEKKSDVGNVGKTRQDQLNEQLDPKGPDAPLKIAQSKMDDSKKDYAIQTAIRTASKADFQKMVEQSASWPKDVRDRFDKQIAAGFGDLAKRIPADLKPDQQLEMVKRLHTGGHFYGVTNALAGADPKVLNQVASEYKSYPGFDSSNRASRDLVSTLAAQTKQLTPENQRKLADDIINDPKVLPDGSYRASTITNMFDGLSETQSRDLFAHIQQSGNLKKMLANFKEGYMREPIKFGEEFLGLGKNELQVIKQTFEQLAAESPKGSDAERMYRENAASAQRRIDYLAH